MRVRITRQPTDAEQMAHTDINLSRYEKGRVYDVHPLIGSYLVVLGLAEPEMLGSEPDPAHRTPGTDTTRPLVLLVDDIVDQLEMYAMALDTRYTIERAVRGQEAFELACTFRPDIIVLDVMLPDMDGVTLCKRLKSTSGTAGIPVVFLTAYETPALKLQAIDAGGVALLSKPCSTDKLIRTIDGALGARV